MVVRAQNECTLSGGRRAAVQPSPLRVNRSDLSPSRCDLTPRWPCLRPERVHARLDSHEEWAWLDVREQGRFDQGHPFWAVNAPSSHLESVIDGLVPRRDTPLVLMDETGEGLALQAAARLAALGYPDISVLDGGLRGWREAGMPVHAGIHVPSKAFGEYVELCERTPSIDVAQLQAWQSEGRDLLLIDCRPFGEYRQASLPGSLNCPGLELVNRMFDLVKRDDTTIIVHCAGRTRGIIGAQSLIDAGLRNPVFSLRNGLGDWFLRGLPFARGNAAVVPPPTPSGLGRAVQAASAVAARFGVQGIDAQQLQAFRADLQRSLYVFDVRSPEEYEAGHLAEARSAPGGQLIQTLDAFVATRGARIVLCDDTGVRARQCAAWLTRMGWAEVFVLEGGLSCAGQALVRGPGRMHAAEASLTTTVPMITVAELHERQRGPMALQTAILDLSSSLDFIRGHLPGSWFAVRSRLDVALGQLPAHDLLVLTSMDGTLAHQAHADAQALSAVPVAVLRGGNAAWVHGGLALAAGPERLTTQTDDVWYSPLDRPDPVAAVREYLAWEIGLTEHLASERGVRFRAGLPVPQSDASTPAASPVASSGSPIPSRTQPLEENS